MTDQNSQDKTKAPRRRPAKVVKTPQQIEIEKLVQAFKRNAEARINQNIGNKLTDELGTGLYMYLIGPIDELIAKVQAHVTDTGKAGT